MPIVILLGASIQLIFEAFKSMKRKLSKQMIFVILSAVLSGTVVFGGAVFEKLGLSAYEVALYSGVPALILTFVLLIKNRGLRFPRKITGLMFLFAFAILVINYSQYFAVYLGAPVPLVVLLLYTQPLWTVLTSWLVLREKITKVQIISCILVLLGTIALVNPFSIKWESSWLGIIVALLGGIGLSGWVSIGNVISKKGNTPLNTKFWSSFIMGMSMILIYPLFTYFVKEEALVRLSLDFGWNVWIALLIYSLATSFAVQILYYAGATKVSAVDSGIIMLLEPLIGSILAVLFLGEILGWNILVGGGFILLANYLVINEEEV
jgi:drug/metabolite transporter (DMT)-like permease